MPYKPSLCLANYVYCSAIYAFAKLFHLYMCPIMYSTCIYGVFLAQCQFVHYLRSNFVHIYPAVMYMLSGVEWWFWQSLAFWGHGKWFGSSGH